MAGALEGELFVGPKAEEHRGLLSLRYITHLTKHIPYTFIFIKLLPNP
jgi:hypothetical protein